MTVTEKQSSTRENILKAALVLFSRKGYLGATTKEIAAEAGIAEVTLFRYFSSKENLLGEVITKRSFLPKLQGLLPEVVQMPCVEGLTVIATRLLDSLFMLKDWIRLLHAEVPRSSDKIRRIYHAFLDELFDTFAAYFTALKERGELRDFDPELGARAFHGIFFCYFNVEEVLLRKEYRRTDREKAIKGFVDIFVSGIRLQGDYTRERRDPLLQN